LLGCETDSYDSEGARVRLAPWRHVTRASVENVLPQFRGSIKQMPPIYSALKMDGKPLYEYAREGKPLPRPIEARDAEVSELELIDWKEGRVEAADADPAAHTYTWPTKELSEADKERTNVVKNLIVKAEEHRPTEGSLSATRLLEAQADETSKENEEPTTADHPPIFGLKMTVSSGTYVRSIVHDIGLALGSAAHVVSLTRTRQGDFALGEGHDSGDCVPWSVIDKAYQEQKSGVPGSPISAASDESKRSEWENVILSKWHE